MAQNKNNNSKKNNLESIIERERIRANKKILRLSSDRKKLIKCLTSIKDKFSSGEDILINNLITEIGKTLQEVNNNKG